MPPGATRRLWGDAFRLRAHGVALGGRRTNRLITCNPAYARLQRSGVADLVGADSLSFSAPAERDRIAALLAAPDERGSASFESEMLRRDGLGVPVQADIVTVRDTDARGLWRVAAVQDISDRRRAAAALAEQQVRLAAIIETASDAIICVDANQRIVLVNPATDEMFAHGRHELLGRALNDLIPERFHATHRGHVEAFATHGASPCRMATFQAPCGLRADGSEFPIEVSISQAKVAGGRPYTAVVRDFSRHRALERESLEAGERERRRISYDLHDAGPRLTGLRYPCDATLRRLDGAGIDVAADLERISHGLGEALRIVRQLARGLGPVDLEHGGLGSALRELAVHSSEFFGLACKARSLTRWTERGLQIMEDRASLLGGMLHARTPAPRGTVISCRCTLLPASATPA